MFDNSDNNKTFITVEEMAQLLRIGRNAAYNLVLCEGFPSYRFGRKNIRIFKEALLEWIKSNPLFKVNKDRED